MRMRLKSWSLLVEMKLYAWSVYPRPNKQRRFLLLANSRTGSHLLLQLLSQHPQIETDGREWMLGKKDMYRPVRMIEGISRRSTASIFGCKVSTRQLMRQRGDTELQLNALLSDGWQFILLQRRNVWRQVVSGMIASQRQVWRDTVPNALANFEVSLDISEMLRRMQHKQKVQTIEKALFAEMPHLALTYEDDLQHEEQHQLTANRIFTMLDLPPAPVRAKFRKTAPQNLRMVLRNYDDIMDALETQGDRVLAES